MAVPEKWPVPPAHSLVNVYSIFQSKWIFHWSSATSLSVCINSAPYAASAGKNVRRSIQGVGQMMSTMVLSRKQSIFSPPSLSAGSAPEQVDRGRSIENENIVVMETKLKILEILQVGASGEGEALWSWGWDL